MLVAIPVVDLHPSFIIHDGCLQPKAADGGGDRSQAPPTSEHPAALSALVLDSQRRDRGFVDRRIGGDARGRLVSLPAPRSV
jgi:hypothetical protein